MMSPLDTPDDIHLMIQALADGELDAADALSVEHRLAADPRLAAEYERVRALKRALGALQRPAVSPAFEARIGALAAPAAASPPASRSGPVFGWRSLAASIVLTAAIAGGGTYLATRPQPGSEVAELVAMGHRRALLGASPVDIATSDRHQVKPWLDAKLGLSPPAVDLASDGFPLIGGRIEVIDGQPVPALVYRHREHLITLVAIPRTPGSAAVPTTTRRAADGLVMDHWTDQAFSYWAVSDVDPSALDQFVARFRASPGAG
jgi:anti-sigma factor RsiW